MGPSLHFSAQQLAPELAQEIVLGLGGAVWSQRMVIQTCCPFATIWGFPICVPTPRTNTGTAGRYWEGLTDLGLGRAPHPASGRLVSIGLEGKHLTVRTHPHPALDHPGTRKAKWVWAGGS